MKSKHPLIEARDRATKLVQELGVYHSLMLLEALKAALRHHLPSQPAPRVRRKEA